MPGGTVRPSLVTGTRWFLGDRDCSGFTMSDVHGIQPITNGSALQPYQWQTAYAYKNIDRAGHGYLLCSLC